MSKWDIVRSKSSAQWKSLEDFSATTELLIAAAEIGHYHEISRCLRAGVDPNSHLGDGFTALHYAAQQGWMNIAQRLLRCKTILVDAISNHGETPLRLAVECGHYNMVKLLLENKADINLRDGRMDKSPLQLAVLNGHDEIAKLLLNNGAEVNTVDCFGGTPLSNAILYRNPPNIAMEKLLLKYGANPNVETINLFPLITDCVSACTNRVMVDAIKTLLYFGADINARSKVSQRNCLHMVAFTGYAPLCSVLIDYGADRCAIDFDGVYPFHIAYVHNNTDVAVMLYVPGVTILPTTQEMDTSI